MKCVVYRVGQDDGSNKVRVETNVNLVDANHPHKIFRHFMM